MTSLANASSTSRAGRRFDRDTEVQGEELGREVAWHVCARTTDREVYGWELNSNGRLGIGDDEELAASPRRVPTKAVTRLSTGSFTTRAAV